MDILKSNSQTVILKDIWRRLFNEIENDDIREAAEAFGKLYLSSYENGEKAFGYNKKLEIPLYIQRENAIAGILEGKNLSSDEKVKLLDVVGMMHKTYEFSQLKAAFNAGSMQKIIDDMLADITKDIGDIDQVLEHFQQVVVDRVLTAHPTFVGKLDYAVLNRELQNAIFENNSQKIEDLFKQFMSPDFSAVVDKNLTVADETAFMIHYLSGAGEDLSGLYAMFDKAMAKKFGDAYNPADLKLNIRFGDWGSSGDKDGNLNVNATTLRDGIPERRKAAAKWHLDNLDELDTAKSKELSTKLLSITSLNAKQIAELKAELETFYQELYTNESSPIALNGMRHLHHMGLSLGYIEMRETAEQFQFVIGRFLSDDTIENIVGIKTNYANLNSEQKDQVLNFLHQADKSEFVRDEVAKAMQIIPEEAKAASYNYKDTGLGKTNHAIFYNTIERLLIAKANGDIFPGQQVLAEAQSPQQLKEMLLLLKATGLEKQILIVPLFEEPEILMDMDNTIKRILGDETLFKYYINHSLERLKSSDINLSEELIERVRNLSPKKRSFTKERDEINSEIKLLSNGKLGIRDVLNIEIQFAHSDNSRRGGTTAARSAIGNSQRIAVEVGRNFGFSVSRYQGGSFTDSGRDGGRDLRAKLNVHDVHDSTGHMKSKATVQGIDIFTLLNGAMTTIAFLGETLAHLWVSNERWDGEKYITPAKRSMAHFANAATPVQQIINSTLGQFKHYQDIHFAHSRLAEAMDQIFKYSECREAGTVGSRAGERIVADPSVAKNKSLSTDATKVRTIGYTEAGQHQYCHFGFIGAGKLREDILGKLSELGNNLITKSQNIEGEESALLKEGKGKILVNDAIKAKASLGLTMTEAFDLAFLTNGNSSNSHTLRTNIASKKTDEIQTDFDNPVLKSNAQILNSLYKDSPLFRDIIDRNANAVASSTDFDKVWATAMATGLKLLNLKGMVIATVYIEHRPEPSELLEAARDNNTMRGYLAGLELDCRKASHLAIEAMTGRPFELKDEMSTTELKLKVRELLLDKGKLAAGDVLHSFADIVRDSIPEEQRTNKLNTTLHHTVDLAVLHGPTPQAVVAEKRARAA